MSIYLFRNFRIVDVRTASSDDGVICRMHGKSDLTNAIATKMGWEVVDGKDNLFGGLLGCKLGGELNLSDLSLIPNGELKGKQIEKLPATVARDFKAVTKGEDEESETTLQFVIAMPATSAKRILEYHLHVGGHDAQLKLNVIGDAQMKLGEDEQPEESAAPPKAAQTLATAREMKQ